MSMNQADIDRLQGVVAKTLHEHWGVFLVEGIILVILGAAAIIVPPLATLSVAIFLGWLFLISGITGLVTTFRMRHAPGFAWSLVSAILGIVAGIVLIAFPASGALSLTLVVIAFFAIEGIATIMYALEHKRELSGRWGWMLVSGVVDLFLAAVILAGFPISGTWAIGLLVGINMMFGGVALIMMALHARTAVPGSATPAR
ncbi:MAG TPA: HdeD family acid-resistance protein [Stellaceae bacterium]|nr:HdeD family acid-resistance protein [Stellaceae bacterium]